MSAPWVSAPWVSAALVVAATAGWPEPGDPAAPPPVPGFVVSSFSPLVAAVAERCLRRWFPAPPPAPPDLGLGTAIVVCSALGDVATAVHVATAVDRGERVGPLLFFQSVPNAVAGYLAARWGLAGPVVCTSPPAGIGDPLAEGIAVARLLADDGDCSAALVVAVDGERAQAVGLAAPARHQVRVPSHREGKER